MTGFLIPSQRYSRGSCSHRNFVVSRNREIYYCSVFSWCCSIEVYESKGFFRKILIIMCSLKLKIVGNFRMICLKISLIYILTPSWKICEQMARRPFYPTSLKVIRPIKISEGHVSTVSERICRLSNQSTYIVNLLSEERFLSHLFTLRKSLYTYLYYKVDEFIISTVS